MPRKEDLAAAAAAVALLVLALRRRAAACQARAGAPALRAALAAAPTPFAAARAAALHAAAALGLPPCRVALLVHDEGLACRGYLVRGDAPLPAEAAAMEALPAWALLGEEGGGEALRTGSGERVARVSAPLGGGLGLLVALLPAGGAGGGAAAAEQQEQQEQQHRRYQRQLCELAACIEGSGLAAALCASGSSACVAEAAPPSAPQPVEPSWSWDVFGGLPLAGGHWPDQVAEERRQFERATRALEAPAAAQGSLAAGKAPPAAAGTAAAAAAAAACAPAPAPAPAIGNRGLAAAVCQGEARLHAAVVEMLCGSRTAALLGPTLRPPAAALEALALRMRAHYRANAFHNYYHAVSVLHCAWLLAGVPGVAARLQPLGTLALLLSALGHDLGHPGHSNALERALGTRRALLHSDSSVLERHHAATLGSLLAECSELQGALAVEQRAALRALVLGAVLHTDIANHAALMQELEALAPAPAGAPPPPPPAQQQQQQQATLVAALLHAADLGGQAYGGEHLQLNWAARIRSEFRSQAALEGALGLPLSPHMQGLHAERDFAASQVHFLSGVALPLWQRLHALLGGLAEPVDNLLSATALFSRRAGLPIL
jgi:hypothetical protein